MPNEPVIHINDSDVVKPDGQKFESLEINRSRWFQKHLCKKQMFQFKNFRVRKLKAINPLNFYLTLCMAFLAIISMESETSALKISIIKTVDPVKEKFSSAITDWQKAS